MRRVWRDHQPMLLIAGVGLIAILSTWIALSIHPTQERERNPASTASPEKLQRLNPVGPDQRSETEPARTAHKGSGSLDVRITTVSAAAADGGQLATVEATVVALTDLDDLEFAWIIPAGTTVVDGRQDGPIGSVEQDQVVRLPLLVSIPAGENPQLSLHVFRMVNGEAHGNMSHARPALATMPEGVRGKPGSSGAIVPAHRRPVKIYQ